MAFVAPSTGEKETKGIGIVIEGVQVITGLGDMLGSVLLSLMYAQLKYTCEAFYKLFWEQQESELSAKVQALQNKLLA